MSPSLKSSYGLRLDINTQSDKFADLTVHFTDMETSHNKPSSKQPFLGCAEYPEPEKIENETVLSMLEQLEAINISPIPGLALGLDGAQYELIIQRGFNKAAYSWWSELPPEWGSLGTLVESFETIINNRR